MSDSHILVVDDHRDIRDPLAAYLRKHDFHVSVAAEAAVARTLLANGAIDLVILDVMMPGEGGLSLCRHIREVHDVPIIILSAMADQTDRIVGLELGADDYMTKPFDPRELLARTRNLLRRARALPRQHDVRSNSRLCFGGWVLDTGLRELRDGDGSPVDLTASEFRLLTAFALRPGVVLSRAQLQDLTGGRGVPGFERGIDNTVSRLRRKLAAGSGAGVIKTVWGGGYVFAADVERLR